MSLLEPGSFYYLTAFSLKYISNLCLVHAAWLVLAMSGSLAFDAIVLRRAFPRGVPLSEMLPGLYCLSAGFLFASSFFLTLVLERRG